MTQEHDRFTSLGSFALARAPETENVDFSQNLSLAGKAQRVRYVKFLILGNQNGADYKHRKPGPDWSMVALSEVKFYRRSVPDGG